jgi:hypothetical protein
VVNMDALVMGNEGVLPPGVDGLLGVVWMRYFGIVDFSWATQTITVYPYDVRGREGGSGGGLEDILEDPRPELLSRGVPMRQDPMSGLHFVDLVLNPGGSPVSALVDLGAGMSIVNWRAARQAGIERYVRSVFLPSLRFFLLNELLDLSSLRSFSSLHHPLTRS